MVAAPSVSYSITVRLVVPTGGAGVSQLTNAVEAAGGVVTALDVSASGADSLRMDVTCAARDTTHADDIVAALDSVEGVDVLVRPDVLMHLGGTIEMASKHPIRNRDELSMVYTPGVARVCLAVARNPEDARRLTIKRNSVAVVTDGSAVLGLGNLGPAAALPVMEGKAALFKRFAGIDAWPLCLDTQDVDEIVRTVQVVAPGFAGINLEDISAPRCFEVEARLRKLLDIPVFHDDQHGTAIVVLAALTNALRVVAKAMADVRIVMSGAGAAGSAIVRLLIEAGAQDVVVADVEGVIHSGRAGLSPSLTWIAEHTNPASVSGSLKDAIAGADVFVGVSAPDVVDGDDIAAMAPDAVVFALANPDPEVDPAVARQHAAVVATGRSDYPNQINNVLAFPGVFRGLLDASASTIELPLLVAAARAIASTVSDAELNANYVIPSVFHEDVHKAVAAAVKDAAGEGPLMVFHTGQLLVATPRLLDPNFRRGVLFMLDHDADGALAVLINRPSELPLEVVLPGWGEAVVEPPLLFSGGPVAEDSALAVGLALGAGPDLGFKRLSGDYGLVDLDLPAESLLSDLVGVRVFSGYAGWGGGQLEAEIAEGSWYVVNAVPTDLLTPQPALLWRDVLRRQHGELAYVATFPDDPGMN